MPADHLSTQRIQSALAVLGRSRFRTRFGLTKKDRAYVHGKGIDTIRSHALDFITGRLAPACPKKDGKQTPFKGHPVFVAQHATATCCRGCLSKWHRIEKGRALSDDEVRWIVALIMAWIDRQLL